MAVTSQARPTARFGEVPVTDWRAAGLIKPSVIKPVLTTIERSLILRRLGQLEQEDRQALKGVLGVIMG